MPRPIDPHARGSQADILKVGLLTQLLFETACRFPLRVIRACFRPLRLALLRRLQYSGRSMCYQPATGMRRQYPLGRPKLAPLSTSPLVVVPTIFANWLSFAKPRPFPRRFCNDDLSGSRCVHERLRTKALCDQNHRAVPLDKLETNKHEQHIHLSRRYFPIRVNFSRSYPFKSRRRVRLCPISSLPGHK